MSEKVVIAVLRREVSSEEIEAFEAAYPGRELKFVRIDSRDYQEHAETCRRLKPDVVLLPLEKPIPSVAMDEGFRHVALRPGEGLRELLPLNPEFKPFEPKP